LSFSDCIVHLLFKETKRLNYEQQQSSIIWKIGDFLLKNIWCCSKLNEIHLIILSELETFYHLKSFLNCLINATTILLDLHNITKYSKIIEQKKISISDKNLMCIVWKFSVKFLCFFQNINAWYTSFPSSTIRIQSYKINL
jgi:hypothetical protein